MKMLRCTLIAGLLTGSLAIRQKKATAEDSVVALSRQRSAYELAVAKTTGIEAPTIIGCGFEQTALFRQMAGHILGAAVWLAMKIIAPVHSPGDFIKTLHKDLDPAFYLVSDSDGLIFREFLGILFQSSFYAFTAHVVSKYSQLHEMEKTANLNNDTATLTWVENHPLGSFHNFLNSYLEGTPADDWDLPPLKEEERKANKEKTDKVMQMLNDTSPGSPIDMLTKAAKKDDWKPDYPWHEEPQLTEGTAASPADDHVVVNAKAQRKNRRVALAAARREAKEAKKQAKKAGSQRSSSPAGYNPTMPPSQYNPTRPPFFLRGTTHGSPIGDIFARPIGLVSSFSEAIPGPAATVTCPAENPMLTLGVPTYRSGGWAGCVAPFEDVQKAANETPLIFWGCCDYQYVTYTTCGMNKAWGDTLLEECLASRAAYYQEESCFVNKSRLNIVRKMKDESDVIYNASQMDSCWCRAPAEVSQWEPDAYAERMVTPMDRCRNAPHPYDRCVCFDDSKKTLFKNDDIPQVFVEASGEACHQKSQSEFPAGGVLSPGTPVKIKADPMLPAAFHDKVGHIVSLEWMNHFEGEPGHAVRSTRTGKAIKKPGDWDWDMVQKKTLGPVLGTHEEWVSRGGYIVRIPWMDTKIGLIFHPTFDQVEAQS